MRRRKGGWRGPRGRHSRLAVQDEHVEPLAKVLMGDLRFFAIRGGHDADVSRDLLENADITRLQHVVRQARRLAVLFPRLATVLVH